MQRLDRSVDVAQPQQTAREFYRIRHRPRGYAPAWVYYYKQNYSQARDLLESALKDTPDNASMHFHLGMTYIKLNDKADAQVDPKKPLPSRPTTRPARTQRGAGSQGKPEE